MSLRVKKTVASVGRSRPAGAQDGFAGSETERKPRRGESQGWDEQPECRLKYMRIPSTAGTRDPERSRFFHKLSAKYAAYRQDSRLKRLIHHWIALIGSLAFVAPVTNAR